MSEGGIGGEEASFVIFEENGVEQGQQLSIGEDGITIVVTPENEQQVSELLRALQASQGDDVRILTESGTETEYKKEESSTDEAAAAPTKKKRGRPAKGASPGSSSETASKKAKMIELALQEADASISEGVSNLRSSRLREKAAKGGLKKLWLNNEDEAEEEGTSAKEEPAVNESEIATTDGEEEVVHKCQECPNVSLFIKNAIIEISKD